MMDAELIVRTSSGSHRMSLASYLTPAAVEGAHERSYNWIKALRNLEIDGEPFREKFTIRGDSLWWFTEIYLHREQVVLDIHRCIAALNELLARQRPSSIEVTSGSAVARHLVPLVASARGITGGPKMNAAAWWRRMARLDLRARWLNTAALLTADRYRGVPAANSETRVAAFIHRAFWRAGGEDGSAESYIGPVLAELERRLAPGTIRYIGVGPSTNFRTRRRAQSPHRADSALVPVERFAPPSALRASRASWRARMSNFRTLSKSTALREVAVIDGIDCWPLVREQLAGVAWLQWPWSVRAMDEAAAAIEVLRPSSVLTYAEAGGWGRALVLEARRRGVPSIGLQHGFIYRHWLNYRHEPDEAVSRGTLGFPFPTRTLLFDEYARRHLLESGHFPSDAIQVTGSPRLDELRSTVEEVRRDGASRVRKALGVADSDTVVLVTTKEKEARGVLTTFVKVAAGLPNVVVVIKPHPAETAEAYSAVASASPRVKIAHREASLAELLVAARAVATVNSTVALDAGALDVPALVLGLPNNLSPFVDAGALAGSTDAAELPELLQRILYDEKFRQHLADQRRAIFGNPSAPQPGRASSAAAEALLTLVHSGRSEAAGSG